MLYAILIDGGFARRMLGSSEMPADSEDIKALVKCIQRSPYLEGHVLHRIYYYDAYTLTGKEKIPLGGGVQDFSNTPLAIRSSEIFNRLKTEPYFAMRMGETSFNGWRVKAQLFNTKEPSITITSGDILANISQKGVDMRIGMDIASLTLKKIVHILVLVTGDSDFVPAMKFARREGANLFTASLGHKVKESFAEHSDLELGITLDDVKNLRS